MNLPDSTPIVFGRDLTARFARIGAAPVNAETQGILLRHRAKVHAGAAHCTHSRVMFADGVPSEIITATRTQPDGTPLTVICLATEWEALTGEPRHQCPGTAHRN